MSSPPAAAADEATGVNPVDEEMTNANDEPMDAAPLQNGNGNAEMETEEQSTEKIAAAAQHANVNRKDATLREFLGRMDEFAPIIPDAVTAHYLTLSGLPPPSSSSNGNGDSGTPLPLARLLALATQKFIADVAADAYQYSRIRASNSNSQAGPGGVVGGAVGGTAVGGVGGGKKEAQLGVQRTGFGGGTGTGGRAVLTMEDLGCAVGEYGVSVRRGEFYR